MKTRELLRAHVITIPQDATLQDAIDRFDLYQVTELPVVDEDGILVGLLVEADVSPAVLTAFSSGSGNKLKNDPFSIYVRDPVSVSEDDDVQTASALLLEHGLSRIPIVFEGKVVGTIGRVDICQAILDESVTTGNG
jgi:CBS domain-containing protein